MNKSFLKWTESNNKILDDLVPLIKSFKKSNIEQTYLEPFLGSGSVFLNIDNFDNYILNDLSVDIFMLFTQIKNNCQILIEDTRSLFSEKNQNKETYNILVEKYNKSNDYYEKCKLLLYLNRHSFNNIVRFNKSGKYNVSFGEIKKPYFPEDEINLMNKILNERSVSLFNHSYERILDNLDYGDVVYCDPPKTNKNHLGFSVEQHLNLTKLAVTNSLKGATIIISNEYNDITKELYKDCSEYYIKKIKNVRKNTEEMIAIYA